MSTYRIDFLAPEGDLEDWLFVEFEEDDEAIDMAQLLNHPNEMRVWEDKRLVAAFTAKT